MADGAPNREPGEHAPWCEDCLEITRSQRECIHCGEATIEAVAEIPDAPGGEGNAGPGPHHGWHCTTCNLLWDGGARYGFACPAHGGHEPPPHLGKELHRGDVIGSDPVKH